LLAGELKRLEEEYTNKVGKYHDRYQGLLDAHINIKQAHADLTRQHENLVTQLSHQNLENGRLESFLEALESTS